MGFATSGGSIAAPVTNLNALPADILGLVNNIVIDSL